VQCVSGKGSHSPFTPFTPRRLRVLVSLGELRTTKACLTRIIHLPANRTFAFPCLLPPFVDVHRRQRGWPKSHESPHGRYGRVQTQADYVVQIDFAPDYDSRTSIQCNLYFEELVILRWMTASQSRFTSPSPFLGHFQRFLIWTVLQCSGSRIPSHNILEVRHYQTSFPSASLQAPVPWQLLQTSRRLSRDSPTKYPVMRLHA
jgi:hypothetical protein